MRNMILSIATQIMVMAIIISIMLLFIGLGVLVLMHACIVGRAFRRGLSTMTRGDTCEGTSHGLSLDDLQQLPCFEFRGSGSAAVVRTVDCAVCLESFQMGEKCRLLPVCKHSFHVQCVDSWLLRTPICPICRTSADHRKIDSVSGVGIELGDTPGVVIGFPSIPAHAPINRREHQGRTIDLRNDHQEDNIQIKALATVNTLSFLTTSSRE